MRLRNSYSKQGKFLYHILFLLLICCDVAAGTDRAPDQSAIASSSPLATRAGAEILRQGGNAFDAAAAMTAVLAVVEPYAAGLGGGGLWLIHRASDGKQVLIDGRETAPELAHRHLYLDAHGRLKRNVTVDGPLAAAIPGTPAAIVHLALDYGRLPLSKTLQPAIEYAEKGFVVDDRYRLLAVLRKADLKKYSASGNFLDHGEIPATGYRIKQQGLADVIKSLARLGAAGFYKGEVAASLVNDINKHGGDWTLNDLANYRIKERAPLVFTYHDMRVVTAPPPSAGGVVLGQAMKILEHFDLRAMDQVSRMHYIIEAMRRGFRDYAVYLGDPDFVDVPVARLLAPDYLDGLAETIDADKATPSGVLGDTPGPPRAGMQTTHFSIIDAQGNRVAGTLSINSIFGSAFVAGKTGILLNNAMNDFVITGNSAVAGRAGRAADSLQPGKRPMTSMTPTFLETKNRLAVLGTPGGNRIISIMLLAALDFSEGEPLQDWIKKPRYHQQYMPDVVEFEHNGLSFAIQRKLHDMGYKLREAPGTFGDLQVVIWDKQFNRVYAASDPRGDGQARLILP